MIQLTKGKTELDRANIYGDVNVESAMARLRRGVATMTTGSRTETASMKFAHMRKHAATTFTLASKNVKNEENEEGADPLALEVDEMAKRYEKARAVLEQLRGTVEKLSKWYESGFEQLAAVAGELAAVVPEDELARNPEKTQAVLQFHATLEEARAALQATFLEPTANQVVAPLAAGLDAYCSRRGQFRGDESAATPRLGRG